MLSIADFIGIMSTNTSETLTPECSVCFTQYDEHNHKPHMLIECGHTFCEECVNRIKAPVSYSAPHILETATRIETRYKCPICKQMSTNHTCNYEVIKICNEYVKQRKKQVEPDPVEKSLKQTLQMTINEIELKTKEYADLKEKASQLEKEIKMLEHYHHPMFDKYFEDVKTEAKKQAEKIIDLAKNKEEKMIGEAKIKSEVEAKARYDQLKLESLQTLERETRQLEEVRQKFKHQRFMENMIQTHKRNFINSYDEIIHTLTELKKFIKDTNITFSRGVTKSSKKELYKSIETITSWEISCYTNYLRKS